MTNITNYHSNTVSKRFYSLETRSSRKYFLIKAAPHFLEYEIMKRTIIIYSFL